MVSLGEVARRGDRWAEWIGQRLAELCALYPVLWIGVAYHLAWMAQLQLGRWPRPSLDDPKSIGGVVSGLHLALTLLLLLWPLSCAAGLYGVGLALQRVGWRGALWRCALLVAVNVGVIALARSDPAGVMAWVMD